MTKPLPSPIILVVDDEARLRKFVALNLTSWGYEVICAVDGAHALSLLATTPTIDLIVLDVMMPKIDGFTLLQRLRQGAALEVGGESLSLAPLSNTPVLLLTAKETLNDKVKGFALGADDYLPKPFALEELHARVAAILRRTRKPEGIPRHGLATPSDEAPSSQATSTSEPGRGGCGEMLLQNGRLRLDTVSHRVWVDETEARLTATEWRLLEYFLQHRGTVLVHEQLLAHLWGDDREADVSTLRVTLARLRQKLRDAGLSGDCGITNYSGVGYLMEREDGA